MTIAVRRGAEGPSAWGIPAATSTPFTAGDFVASVAAGGSVNCDVWSLTVHSAGTHTETALHVVKDGAPTIDQIEFAPLIDAVVVNVAPVPLAATGESYPGEARPEDHVVSADALRTAFDGLSVPIDGALVVLTGTLRTDSDAHFSDEIPPYFTTEAMRWIARVARPRHLLVDLPSVDRLWDGGLVANHKEFWGVATDHVACPERTITEFVRAAPEATTGYAQLQLSVSSWRSDAAPSRVTLHWPAGPYGQKSR